MLSNIMQRLNRLKWLRWDLLSSRNERDVQDTYRPGYFRNTYDMYIGGLFRFIRNRFSNKPIQRPHDETVRVDSASYIGLILQKSTLLPRFLVYCFFFILIVLTKYDVGKYFLNSRVPVPSGDDVFQLLVDTVKLINAERTFYESCVERQILECQHNLNQYDTAKRSFIEKAKEHNSRTTLESIDTIQQCSSSLKMINATIVQYSDIYGVTPPVKNTPECENFFFSGYDIQRRITDGSFDGTADSYTSLSKSKVETLGNVAIERSSYDFEVLQDMTAISATAESRVQDILSDSVEKNIIFYKEEEYYTAEMVEQLIICLSPRAQNVDSFCKDDINARRLLDELLEKIHMDLTTCKSQISNYAIVFKKYQQSAESSYENVEKYYDSSYHILSSISSATIDFLVPDNSDEWKSISEKDMQTAIPDLPQIEDNVYIYDTLDDIWFMIQGIYSEYKDDIADLSYETNEKVSDYKIESEKNVQIIFEEFRAFEYVPPRFCEVDINSLSEYESVWDYYELQLNFETECLENEIKDYALYSDQYLLSTKMLNSSEENSDSIYLCSDDIYIVSNSTVIQENKNVNSAKEGNNNGTMNGEKLELYDACKSVLESKMKYEYFLGVTLLAWIILFFQIKNLVYGNGNFLSIPTAHATIDSLYQRYYIPYLGYLRTIIYHPTVPFVLALIVWIVSIKLSMIFLIPFYNEFEAACVDKTRQDSTMTKVLFLEANNYVTAEANEMKRDFAKDYAISMERVCNNITTNVIEITTRQKIQMDILRDYQQEHQGVFLDYKECIDSTAMENQLNFACCGYTDFGYTDCDGYVPNRDDCPFISENVPFPKISEQISDSSCDPGVTNFDLHVENLINCSEIPSCIISCKEPDLRPYTFVLGCFLEGLFFYGHIYTLAMMGIYLFLNIARIMIFVGLLKLIGWRKIHTGHFAFSATCKEDGTLVASKDNIREGRVFQKQLTSIMKLTIRQWSNVAWIELFIGLGFAVMLVYAYYYLPGVPELFL